MLPVMLRAIIIRTLNWLLLFNKQDAPSKQHFTSHILRLSVSLMPLDIILE